MHLLAGQGYNNVMGEDIFLGILFDLIYVEKNPGPNLKKNRHLKKNTLFLWFLKLTIYQSTISYMNLKYI